MNTQRLNPRILGQAENAHRALLEHLLHGTGLTYQRWVVLTFASASDHVLEADMIHRLVGALKIERAGAVAGIAELTAPGFLDRDAGDLHMTEEGAALYRRIRVRVDEIVADLYRGIPTRDLDVAGRVLGELTERAGNTLQALERGVAPHRRDDTL